MTTDEFYRTIVVAASNGLVVLAVHWWRKKHPPKTKEAVEARRQARSEAVYSACRALGAKVRRTIRRAA